MRKAKSGKSRKIRECEKEGANVGEVGRRRRADKKGVRSGGGRERVEWKGAPVRRCRGEKALMWR